MTQLLHRHHPRVKLRTSMTTDGVLTVSVPVRFATDQEASWLAHLIGNLLGCRYSVHIRVHQPSRSGVRIAPHGTRSGVHATLTLRPVDTAPHLEPAPGTAEGTAP